MFPEETVVAAEPEGSDYVLLYEKDIEQEMKEKKEETHD